MGTRRMSGVIDSSFLFRLSMFYSDIVRFQIDSPDKYGVVLSLLTTFHDPKIGLFSRRWFLGKIDYICETMWRNTGYLILDAHTVRDLDLTAFLRSQTWRVAQSLENPPALSWVQVSNPPEWYIPHFSQKSSRTALQHCTSRSFED